MKSIIYSILCMLHTLLIFNKYPMAQFLTPSQIEVWMNKIRGKQICLFWHSIGTYLWIELGDAAKDTPRYELSNVQGEFTLSTSRLWSIRDKNRVILEVDGFTPHELIHSTLEKITASDLELRDLILFKNTAKIILNKGYEIILKEPTKYCIDLSISFHAENKYLFFDKDNNGHLQNCDDPIDDEYI